MQQRPRYPEYEFTFKYRSRTGPFSTAAISFIERADSSGLKRIDIRIRNRRSLRGVLRSIGTLGFFAVGAR